MINCQASIQLVHVWSTYLDLIQRYKIKIPLNLGVELFRCLYHPMPLHYFFFWMSIDTHIRFLADHRILRWINIWPDLHILKPLSSPLIWIGIAESYPLLWPRYSNFKAVPLSSDVCRMDSLKLPMGGIYTSIICVNPETSTGHTLLVLRQTMIQHNNFIEIEKWIERWYIEEVGVDPEPLCSCPWIQCRTYHESSL